MTDTWAAKVLEGVRRCHTPEGTYLHKDGVLAAIARMGAGDRLVERLQKLADDMGKYATEEWDESELVNAAIAHIAALTAQLAEKEEQLVSVLRREAATHERHDAKVARLEGAGQRLVNLYDAAMDDLLGVDVHRSNPDSDEMAEIRQMLGAPALTGALTEGGQP